MKENRIGTEKIVNKCLNSAVNKIVKLKVRQPADFFILRHK